MVPTEWIAWGLVAFAMYYLGQTHGGVKALKTELQALRDELENRRQESEREQWRRDEDLEKAMAKVDTLIDWNREVRNVIVHGRQDPAAETRVEAAGR